MAGFISTKLNAKHHSSNIVKRRQVKHGIPPDAKPLLCKGLLSVNAILSMFTNVFVHAYNKKLIEIWMRILLSAIFKKMWDNSELTH